MVINEQILDRYMDALLKGDRKAARKVIEESLQSGIPANQVYMNIIWPVMVEIDTLFRHDKIDTVAESLASKINRTLIDQLQNKLPRKEVRNKKIVICNARNEHGELGGQMIADLFESDGWDVRFLGGTVSQDDLLKFTHDFKPDVLMVYGTTPKEAPDVRLLIDTIKGINALPEMKIMLSGGLFNRADGLWEEIGADLYAADAQEALLVASDRKEIAPPQRTINKRKKTLPPLPEKLRIQLAG